MTSLLETPPMYMPSGSELGPALERAIGAVQRELGRRVLARSRCGGQGLNHRLDLDDGTVALLKVLRLSGYPSAANLRVSSELLRAAGIAHPDLLLEGAPDDLLPYGYVVTRWLDGEFPYNRAIRMPWLDACVRALRAAHSVRLAFFGGLAGQPRYSSAAAYYAALDEVVTHSFGGSAPTLRNLADLETLELVTPGFVRRVVTTCAARAQATTSPIRSVLVHGDPLPANLLRTARGPVLIDWAEARAGWWVADVARITYYIDLPGLADAFYDAYRDDELSPGDFATGIRLEHVRQQLRQLVMPALRSPASPDLRRSALRVEERILRLLSVEHHDTAEG